MLGVTAVRAALRGVAAGVAEQLDETVVVTNEESVAIRRLVHTVDVGAVSATGENGLIAPCEVDGSCSPFDTGGVALSASVLLAVFCSEVQNFVSTAVGPNIFGLQAPVKGNNERGVSFAAALQAEATTVNVVNANKVVVGTNTQHSVIR